MAVRGVRRARVDGSLAVRGGRLGLRKSRLQTVDRVDARFDGRVVTTSQRLQRRTTGSQVRDKKRGLATRRLAPELRTTCRTNAASKARGTGPACTSRSAAPKPPLKQLKAQNTSKHAQRTMKIKVLARSARREARDSGDQKFARRNLDPGQHPFAAAREHQRAVVAAKLERMMAKPFVCALDGHRDAPTCLAAPRRGQLVRRPSGISGPFSIMFAALTRRTRAAATPRGLEKRGSRRRRGVRRGFSAETSRGDAVLFEGRGEPTGSPSSLKDATGSVARRSSARPAAPTARSARGTSPQDHACGAAPRTRAP